MFEVWDQCGLGERTIGLQFGQSPVGGARASGSGYPSSGTVLPPGSITLDGRTFIPSILPGSYTPGPADFTVVPPQTTTPTTGTSGTSSMMLYIALGLGALFLLKKR